MAVLVKTCCCGCSLRSGVVILGIIGLLGSAYSIYQQSNSFKVYKYLEENADEFELSQNLPFSKSDCSLGYVYHAFKVISLLMNLLLLGSSSGEKRLAYPWLGWSIFELFFNFGATISYIAIWNGFPAFSIIYITGWLLSIYFIVAVYSYIEALREDPSGTSAGFSPPLTSVNQTQMVITFPLF
ncbi:unnamed protein product [Pocillopora meandrina]|uniref:Uncharacterized protein n=1 Tax=Pocillopora meandrina TaxID=46732 RepID=A0AAU9WXU3_9CNID|nr:unnamed protein product [Pocillopora meandrina]